MVYLLASSTLQLKRRKTEMKSYKQPNRYHHKLIIIRGNNHSPQSNKQNIAQNFKLTQQNKIANQQQNVKNNLVPIPIKIRIMSRSSSEKQPKISINKHTKDSQIQNKKQVLKLNTIKTQNQLIHDQSYLKTYLKLSPLQQNMVQISDVKYEHLINEILSLLKSHMIISQPNSVNYSIKKKNLQEIMNLLVKTICIENTSQLLQQYKNYSYLHDIIKKIYIINKIQRITSQTAKLTIKSQTFNLAFNHRQYQQETHSYQQQIMTLVKQKQNLAQQNQQLQHNLCQIKNECDLKFAQHSHLSKLLYQIEQKIKTQSLNLSNIQKGIKKGQILLNNIKIKQESIFNFVQNQDKHKLLKQAEKDFKDIQSDMYQFASYLQCNVLAHDLSYQPHPFREIEETLIQDMKEINITLKQNKQLSIQEKQIRMRDFVLNCMRIFKNKDKDLQQLLDFKTRCIQKYIAIMKRYLNNYDLKKEYLVNLRTQFGVDNDQMCYNLTTLQKLQCCKSCKASSSPLISKLIQIYDKIQNNYKMGNCFY